MINMLWLPVSSPLSAAVIIHASILGYRLVVAVSMGKKTNIAVSNRSVAVAGVVFVKEGVLCRFCSFQSIGGCGSRWFCDGRSAMSGSMMIFVLYIVTLW